MHRADMWTDEEIALLVKHYPRYGTRVDKWPERIDRTPCAIKGKAAKIGLVISSNDAKFRMPKASIGPVSELMAELARKLGITTSELVIDITNMRRMGML